MAIDKHKGSGLTWFVRRGKRVRGPFNSTRIRHFVMEGKLNLDDEVSPDRETWSRLGQVDEVVPLKMREGEKVFEALDDKDRRRDRMRALRSITVVVLLIGGLATAIMLSGESDQTVSRDCMAQAVPGVDLEGCDLSARRLADVDLSAASLASVNLGGVSMSAAILNRADLRYADLSAADLSYTDLGGALLKGANLRGADLTNADLRHADLGFADLSGAAIGGTRFDQAQLAGAIWIDAAPCERGNCPR